MRNSILALAVLCAVTFALPVPVIAQETQPGEACAAGDIHRFKHVGGPENPGTGYMLVCDGSNWKLVTEWDTVTGNTLFQVDYDSAACDALKEGRLRYSSSGDLWEYCHTNAWTAFGGGTPAGADREIQFNSGGAFSAVDGLVYTSMGTLRIGGATSTGYGQFVLGDIVQAGDGSVDDSTVNPGEGHRSAIFALSSILSFPFTIPKVTGNESFAILMGDQVGLDFAAPETMGLFGGQFVIDPGKPATNLSADTALEVEGTLKIGSGGEACDAAREGAMRYIAATDTFEVCKTAGSWTSMQGGTPAGADREIQFNSGGSFGADANFVFSSVGYLGIGDSTPDAALDVVGDINFTGVIVDVSDIRLKENVRPLQSPLQKLTGLNGFAFEMKGDPKHQTEYGVSAQNVREVFPDLVHEVNSSGTLGVNYNGLIAPMIEAIKELKAENEMLKARLEALERQQH